MCQGFPPTSVGTFCIISKMQFFCEGIGYASLEGGLVAWLEQGLETEGAKFEEDFGEGE